MSSSQPFQLGRCFQYHLFVQNMLRREGVYDLYGLLWTPRLSGFRSILTRAAGSANITDRLHWNATPPSPPLLQSLSNIVTCCCLLFLIIHSIVSSRRLT